MLALDADKATINVDRLLRLPGTINILNKKKRERGRQPRAASIMELSDRVFTLADFRSVDADAAPSTRSSKRQGTQARSEEHTSELQSLMRISYAVFCLKKKKKQKNDNQY